MEIIEISQLIKPILEENMVSLYEIKWLIQGKDRILQIAVMNEMGTMDLDTCQNVSEAISLCLDNSALSDATYFLEVCSPGAERAIKSKDEYPGLVGQHLYFTFIKPEGKLMEVKGDLIAYENHTLTVSYQVKAVKRKLIFSDENVAKANLAVRI